MASNNSTLDESIVTLDWENTPVSFVLSSMGINVKKQNYGARLKGAIDNFNACYLDAMDFLTQILPMAKQHFGKHDTILLPKTPSKKRKRQYFDQKGNIELEDKENVQPNVAPEPESEPEEQPFKRTTRSSKTRNSGKEVELTKQSKGQKKTTPKPWATSKVSDTAQPQVKFNVEKVLVETVGIENDQSAVQKGLKRSTSSSPTLKQGTKRSKSSEDLPAVVNIAVNNQLVDYNQGPSHRSKELEKKSKESYERESELIVLVEHTGNDMLDNRARQERNKLERTESEKRKIDEIDDLCRMKKKTHISDEQNSQQTDPVPSLNKRKESDEKESPHVSSSSYLYMKKRRHEDQQTNLAAPSPANSSILALDISVDKVKNLAGNGHVAADTKNLDTSHNRHKDSIISSVTVAHQNEGILIDLPIDKTGDILNKVKPQETVTQPDETSAEETVPDNLESIRSNTEALANPQPLIRRSTRSLRRSSRVSLVTQNKRRSSRRLSCQASRRSSCFKKPLAVKKVENNPSDSELSGTDSGLDCKLSGKDKPSSALSKQSSTESEEESNAKSVSPISSTPDINKESRSPWTSTKMSLKVDQNCHSKDSPNQDEVMSLEGKVSGMVQEINRNAKGFDEQGNVVGTPNGARKVKRLGSALKRSSSKPYNIVGGNIRSFIKHPSTKKLDANELVRQRKLELQRKEEKEKERKDQAELRRKNWVEEQKRKREEKQKRVAEAKAAREKEEKEKKQRQLEEKKNLLQVLEQAKKKREQEEESKKKLREQRKKEADARRLKENEERLKRLHEKEEEDRVYREMLKRKQEHEEQERKHRILEEKRLQEQKHRERQREQAEERQRKLREIKEKEQKRLEKEQECDGRALPERKNKEDGERKEKAEKEREQKEQEDREKKRIAQLIKAKVEQEKKLWEEKRQKEEKERREREEQKKQREAHKLNQLSAASAANKPFAYVKSSDSYQMTPPPCLTRKPSTDDNYDISDIRSDESTDDEDCPRKKVPAWAQGAALKAALLNQTEPRQIFESDNGPHVVHPPDLDQIFQKKRKRFYYRTSSAHWDSPPIKKSLLLS